MMSHDSEYGQDTYAAEMTEPAANTPLAPKTKHRAASYDRGVQIAADRVRLVMESQLGQETPAWVEELAAGKSLSHVS